MWQELLEFRYLRVSPVCYIKGRSSSSVPHVGSIKALNRRVKHWLCQELFFFHIFLSHHIQGIMSCVVGWS